MKLNTSIILEWGGVIAAILYSFFVALNIGFEFAGFFLLVIFCVIFSTSGPEQRITLIADRPTVVAKATTLSLILYTIKPS